MTKIKFFAICVCALALGSCVKDADISSDSIQSSVNGNTTFEFVISNAETTSKATTGTVEDSGVHDQGIEEEYAVNSVVVYLFDTASETLAQTVSLQSITLTSDTSSDYIVRYTSDKFDVDEGSYNVFAVANGVSNYTGLTQSDFLAYVDDATYSSGRLTAVPSGGFVMTNRASENLNVAISKNSDVVVSVELERVVAKIDVSQNYDSFDLKDLNDDVYATVKLHEYKLVNLPTEYYLYRHEADLSSFTAPSSYSAASNFGDVSNSNGYVIDPYFFSKNVATVSTFTNADSYFTQFLDDVTATSGWTEMKDSNNSSVNYCLENTLYVDSQVNGYTTGVVFEAVITPNEILTATGVSSNLTTPIYYCNYKFYDSIASLMSRLGGNIYTLDGVAITENTSTADLQDVNIIRITDYQCYYNYWIKHYDNDDAKVMGVMEFGVVRNNHYQIGVNSITSVGTGEPEVEKDQPDETSETLTVNINVVPWIVRNQGSVELN